MVLLFLLIHVAYPLFYLAMSTLWLNLRNVGGQTCSGISSVDIYTASVNDFDWRKQATTGTAPSLSGVATGVLATNRRGEEELVVYGGFVASPIANCPSSDVLFAVNLSTFHWRAVCAKYLQADSQPIFQVRSLHQISVNDFLFLPFCLVGYYENSVMRHCQLCYLTLNHLLKTLLLQTH